MAKDARGLQVRVGTGFVAFKRYVEVTLYKEWDKFVKSNGFMNSVVETEKESLRSSASKGSPSMGKVDISASEFGSSAIHQSGMKRSTRSVSFCMTGMQVDNRSHDSPNRDLRYK